MSDVPTFLMDKEDLPISVIEMLAKTGIASSKREAKQLVEQGGISFGPSLQSLRKVSSADVVDMSDFGALKLTVGGKDYTVRLKR